VQCSYWYDILEANVALKAWCFAIALPLLSQVSVYITKCILAWRIWILEVEQKAEMDFDLSIRSKLQSWRLTWKTPRHCNDGSDSSGQIACGC